MAQLHHDRHGAGHFRAGLCAPFGAGREIAGKRRRQVAGRAAGAPAGREECSREEGRYRQGLGGGDGNEVRAGVAPAKAGAQFGRQRDFVRLGSR